MNKVLKRFLAIPLLWLLCSNVSQPGVYNSGGMAFTMLFPEDTLAYKKVQMREERIYIQLYKGYAVVKGVYKMVNTSSENLSFRMGYPIRGIYNGGGENINQVSLDSIYKFKVLSNGNTVTINAEKSKDTDKVMAFGSENWLIWPMIFSPQETKTVTVYFIVNTNNGRISKGYSKEELNVFTYLLESGIVWKQPIVKGFFRIGVQDGLDWKTIRGLSEHFHFKKATDNSLLFGEMTNFSPTPNDNLLITYGEKRKNFDFQKILENDKELFRAIDVFANLKTPQLSGELKTTNPYEVSFDALAFLPLLLAYLIIYGPFVLFGIFGFIIFRYVYKKFKN